MATSKSRITVQQIKFSRLNNFLFSWKRSDGHRMAYALNRMLYWYMYPKFHILSPFPKHIDIEISTLCNMRCPMCYTQTDVFRNNVKKEFMPFELFKKIIDEASQKRAFSVRLSLRGESFIHPHALEMARYAKKSKIKEVSSLTNLLALTPQAFEELVKMQFDWLTISFDGMGKTYEGIRAPATFEESYNKLKEFKAIKDKYRSTKPVIKIQTIWPAIENDPMEFYSAMSPYADQVASNPLQDNSGMIDYDYVEHMNCPMLYQRFVITASGKVILCANDDYQTTVVGDITNQSIYDVWHGSAYSRIRNLHKKFGGYKEIHCCRECNVTRKMAASTRILNGKNITVFEYASSQKQ
jgi:radical SAM protein with 4Fe4S-binding SPASM domain